MKKTWVIGFIVVLVGLFAVIWLAGRKTNLPSPTATPQNQVQFDTTDKDHIKGAANAKVTIVEFSDFQCPACRAYYPILNKLVEKFPNDVRVVYKHFPLKSIHIGAVPAARVAEASGAQGKFWEMHNALFDNQDEWANAPSSKLFEKYAESIGLDLDKFRQDLDSDELKNRVEADYDKAVEIGLNSTPSFYLNNKKIENPKSLDEFESLIRAELTKTQ